MSSNEINNNNNYFSNCNGRFYSAYFSGDEYTVYSSDDDMGLGLEDMDVEDMEFEQEVKETAQNGLLALPAELLVEIVKKLFDSQDLLSSLRSVESFSQVCWTAYNITQHGGVQAQIKEATNIIFEGLLRIKGFSKVLRKAPALEDGMLVQKWVSPPATMVASIIANERCQTGLVKIAGDILDKQFGCGQLDRVLEDGSLTDLPLLFHLMGSESRLKVFKRRPHNRLYRPTWLVEAVAGKCFNCARLLLAAGMDPNKGDAYGELPLSKAVENEDLSMIECLLQAKANPNAKETIGRLGLAQSMTLDFDDQTVNTPLFKALVAPFPKPAVVRLLMDHKGDPSVGKGYFGNTAIEHLSATKNAEILKVLMEYLNNDN